MRAYKANIHSQNGEDGILAEIFLRMGIAAGTSCEFGAADGYWLSNTRALVERGWRGLFYEKDGGVEITPENVNHYVPQDLDLLSIDIDGKDWLVWESYTGAAKVVVIEINSGWNPTQCRFSLTGGASFSMMNELASNKGYALVCHTGNCIYVRKEYAHLFPDADPSFDSTEYDEWVIQGREAPLPTDYQKPEMQSVQS